MELLARHGGIWLDATIFLSGGFPHDLERLNLFTVRHGLFPTHVCRGRWTGFFIASRAGHPFISYSRDFLYEYWKKEDMQICYLLIDVAFATAYESFDWARRAIDAVPFNNRFVFELENHLNERYDKTEMERLFKECSIHKLSYRYYLSPQEETYWAHLKTDYLEANGG